MMTDNQNSRLRAVVNAVNIKPEEFTEGAILRLEYLASLFHNGRQNPAPDTIRLEIGILAALLMLADHAEFLDERVTTAFARNFEIGSSAVSDALPAPSNVEGDTHD